MCHSYQKFKTSIKSWISFKNFHGVIKFNQKDWLKPYIYMNTELRQKVKSNFKKHFCKLLICVVFENIKENVRKHRDIKLVPTERRRNYLVSEASYHTTKFFTENLLAIEMKQKIIKY